MLFLQKYVAEEVTAYIKILEVIYSDQKMYFLHLNIVVLKSAAWYFHIGSLILKLNKMTETKEEI